MVQAGDMEMSSLARWRQSRPHRVRGRFTWEHFRYVFFCCVMSLLWIVPNPNSVSFREDPNAGREGTLTIQLLWFGLLAFGLLVTRDRLKAVRQQFDTTFVLLTGWCLLTTFVALVPDVSFRRFLFCMVCVMLIFLMFGGIRNLRSILYLIVFMCLIETITKFAFVYLIPQVGRHGYFGAEPQLNGLWRGQYAHKNIAGPICALELVVLFAARRWIPTYVLAPLALLELVFLINSGSKTPLFLIVIVMILSRLVVTLRSGFAILATVTAGVAFLNVITLASLVSDTAKDLAQKIIGDVTFTGRIELWRFLLHYAADEPLIGAGFQSFWQIGVLSPAVSRGNSWTTAAVYGHNGFLDTLVMIGVPGLALTLLFVVARPALDLGAVRNRRDPMLQMFVAFWLFGLFENGTESLLLARSDAVWLFLVAGLVGIRRFRFDADLANGPEPKRVVPDQRRVSRHPAVTGLRRQALERKP